jgi:ankyrin repeat protein
VELLLKNGAQPDFEDEKGWTPLLRSIDGHEGEHVVVVQLLLAQRVKVNYQCEFVSKSNHIRIGLY